MSRLTKADEHLVTGEEGRMAGPPAITVDLEETVRCLRPVVESSTHIMCKGCRGSLWEAMKLVTSDMVGALAQVYGMEEETACRLSTASVPKDFTYE